MSDLLYDDLNPEGTPIDALVNIVNIDISDVVIDNMRSQQES